ncbi:partner of Y14 and mago [Entomortierella parvispora]|uniref:Partner of Y14 and mago n=1 Tax=Entomortierella parvispora TaxID=205924 RepID=A0A9P3H9P4_9FUNG|nr:partner of Y14 and mago [Entomortierella parvispora]
MSASSAPTKTLSGIQEKEDDVRVIPMTRRPDGTYRKERKVRPGYTPPEDVAKYTNTVLSSNRPAPTPATPISTTPKTKTQLKNEKRKIKRKEETGPESEPSMTAKSETKETAKAEQNATTATVTEAAEPVDTEKKLRALSKKLRQIEQLKERQDKGETLIPEQVEKISKLEEIMAQIAELKI